MTLWHAARRLHRYLDNSILGDALGALSLFATLWMALVAGWALS